MIPPAGFYALRASGTCCRTGSTVAMPRNRRPSKSEPVMIRLRVLQTRLDDTNSIAPIVTTLIRKALDQQAIGVRWAVYDVDEKAAHLVSELRRNGFVCARRIRIMMVHKNDPKFVDTRLWNINDSLFSFDP